MIWDDAYNTVGGTTGMDLGSGRLKQEDGLIYTYGLIHAYRSIQEEPGGFNGLKTMFIVLIKRF